MPWFGIGTYFAENASKTAYYSSKQTAQGRRCVLLARVMLGNPYCAVKKFKGSRAPDGYDSLYAETEPGEVLWDTASILCTMHRRQPLFT